MRLISRNDTSLVVGLIAGTVVVFQRPLRSVWAFAVEVQDRFQVDLLPALTILASVLLFHEYRKRQQTRADAVTAASEARRHRERSAQLERLTAFSQALANALDRASLQQVLWHYLPAFVDEREFWLLARQSERWEPLVVRTGPGQQGPERPLELLADRAISPATLLDARLQGIQAGDAVCYPVIAAGAIVGVLGIDDGADMTTEARQAVAAAAAFIAFAVRNVQLFVDMREHSVRDSLTDCLHRGHALEMLERELQLANREQRPLSIVMFDIDRFKSINDRLGHLRGDDVLRAVGAQLTRVLRRTDLKCRYGGDEFLIVLADTPLAGARQVAEAIRREIGTLALVDGEATLTVTTSFGVAMAEPGEPGVTSLIQRADDALYAAKRAGRNQTRTQAEPVLDLLGVE
jgi:diguanylate cyclase (GGDEF)-like protein